MREPRVKGIAFRSVLRALEQQAGADTLNRAYERMDEGPRDALRYGSLVASSWYPISWYRSMWRGVLAASPGVPRLAWRLGREAALMDMRGIYRLVFVLIEPSTVLSLSPRLFRNYYDTGEVIVRASSATSAQVEWRGCSGFDRAMWHEVFGSAEAFLELAGAKGCDLRLVAGGGEQDDSATIDGRWRR